MKVLWALVTALEGIRKEFSRMNDILERRENTDDAPIRMQGEKETDFFKRLNLWCRKKMES